MCCAGFPEFALIVRGAFVGDGKGARSSAYDRIVSNAPLSKPSSETLLIFDGDCSFCTTWVNRLEAALPTFPPSTPWQWIDIGEYALTPEDVAKYAWVVTPGGHYAGHLAASALLRMQPHFALRFLGHLIATPPFSWISAVAYGWISKNRHRLPGGTPACALPPRS